MSPRAFTCAFVLVQVLTYQAARAQPAASETDGREPAELAPQNPEGSPAPSAPDASSVSPSSSFNASTDAAPSAPPAPNQPAATPSPDAPDGTNSASDPSLEAAAASDPGDPNHPTASAGATPSRTPAAPTSSVARPSLESARPSAAFSSDRDAAAPPHRPTEEDRYPPEDLDSTLTTFDGRTRDVQKVPAYVVTLSGNALERRGTTSVRQLTANTPFVEIGEQHGNFDIHARGLGDGDENGLGDTSIAAFVDGVYIPRARGFRPLFFDTERVEITLGPQSVLRGRAAFAGSIHVVNKTARLGEWSADGNVQLGNYNQRVTRGALNVPVGERLALRLAVLSERHDPFFVNEGGTPLLRAAENADRWASRLTARWEPAERIAITVRFDTARENGTGTPGADYTQAVRSGLLPDEVPNPRSSAFVGNQPSLAVEHWGVSSHIEVDLGRVALEASSSYRSLTYDQHTGHNRTNFPGARPQTLDSYSDTVWSTRSQSALNELRALSSDDGHLRWMVGFFHFSEWQSSFRGHVNDPAPGGQLGSELNLNDIPNGALAGYVDTTTEITDAFRAIAGFRLTSEYRQEHGIGGAFTLACNPTALAEAQRDAPAATCLPPSDPAFGEAVRYGTPGFEFSGDARTDYTRGRNADTLVGTKSRIDTFHDGVAAWGSRDDVARFLEQPGADVGRNFVEQHEELTTLIPDFRLGAEWDLAEQSLVYVTFNTGHRRGGFNEVGLGAVPATYAPATLYATELGSKSSFLNKRYVLDAAAFWYTQANTQLTTFEEVGRVGTSVRSNAGHSRVLGLSIDASGYLLNGVSARVSANFQDARYLDGTVVDRRLGVDGGPEVDIGGNLLPRAPRVALAYGVSQVVPTLMGDFDWSLSGQAKSTMYMTPYNSAGAGETPQLSDLVPWTARWDASVGYARSEGDLRVDAFVTNITNLTYMTSLLASPNSHLRTFNTPRQFGLRVSLYL